MLVCFSINVGWVGTKWKPTIFSRWVSLSLYPPYIFFVLEYNALALSCFVFPSKALYNLL
ncbi:MAG: hypothetical protein KAI83_11260 [Thiomargarita sp.]|nr:hypothetical protein [Thiomargarita sp.]